MGLILSFECPKCGFKGDFTAGGAGGDDKYAVAEMSRENALEQAIRDGQYDERLQDMINRIPKKYRFDCNVDFIQCDHCLALQPINRKRVVYEGNGYTEVVDIDQACCKCGEKLNFQEFDRFKPICPECKAAALDNTKIGRF